MYSRHGAFIDAVDLFDASGKHVAVAQVNYIRLRDVPHARSP